MKSINEYLITKNTKIGNDKLYVIQAFNDLYLILQNEYPHRKINPSKIFSDAFWYLTIDEIKSLALKNPGNYKLFQGFGDYWEVMMPDINLYNINKYFNRVHPDKLAWLRKIDFKDLEI